MIKVLAIISAALLAASAIAVSAASAAEFKSASSPVTFFGAQGPGQTNKFTIQGTTASCSKAGYESAATNTPAATVTVEPKYETCTNFGFSTAQSVIETNGCKFEFLQPNVSLQGNVAIRCPSGQSIKIFAESFFSTCEVRIGEPGNANRQGLSYTNLGGSPSKFEASFTVAGMTAEVTKSTGFCPLSVELVTTATYAARVNIEGKTGIGVSVS
jgi:hypothetical protein